MGQNPDIAAYSPEGVRDRVSQAALGNEYSYLNTTQQAIIDLIINERFRFVYMALKRLGEVADDDSDLPDDFQQLLAVECIHAAVREMRDSQVAEIWSRERSRIWQDTLAYHTPDWTNTTVQASATTTFAAIDKWVCSKTLRHEEGPFVVPTRDVQQSTRHCFFRIWNARKWNFRRRHARFTINTSGQLEGDFTFTFDQLGVNRFYYTDAPSRTLEWVSPDTMSYYRAKWDGDTGRPRFFTITDEGSSKKWHVEPTPDQEYEVDGALFIATPSLPTSTTSTSGFSDLPPEFHPVLWEMVYGRTLIDHGRNASGNRIWNSANKSLDNYGAEYTDLGRTDGSLELPNVARGLLDQELYDNIELTTD